MSIKLYVISTSTNHVEVKLCRCIKVSIKVFGRGESSESSFKTSDENKRSLYRLKNFVIDEYNRPFANWEKSTEASAANSDSPSNSGKPGESSPLQRNE